jgi:hypothetical protein
VSKHVAEENRVDESLPELGTVFSVEPATEGRTTMSIEPQTGLRDIAAGKKQKTGAKSAYVGEQDLDPEERAAFAEVARKGYYHGRPASDTTTSTPAPILISVSGDGGTDSHKRTEVDAFQRKWDKFDSDDFINNIECGDDMQEKPTGLRSPASQTSEQMINMAGSFSVENGLGGRCRSLQSSRPKIPMGASQRSFEATLSTDRQREIGTKMSPSEKQNTAGRAPQVIGENEPSPVVSQGEATSYRASVGNGSDVTARRMVCRDELVAKATLVGFQGLDSIDDWLRCRANDGPLKELAKVLDEAIEMTGRTEIDAGCFLHLRLKWQSLIGDCLRCSKVTAGLPTQNSAQHSKDAKTVSSQENLEHIKTTEPCQSLQSRTKVRQKRSRASSPRPAASKSSLSELCGKQIRAPATVIGAGGPKLCSSYSKRQKTDGEQKKNGLGED